MTNPLRALRAIVFVVALGAMFPVPAFAQKVLVLAAEDAISITDVQAKLMNTHVFTKVDVLDVTVAGSTPTLAQLLAYDAVLTWSNNDYADSAGLGDVLAAYVDQGHGVVQAVFALSPSAPASLSGRWRAAGYAPLSGGAVVVDIALTLVANLPQHAILKNVHRFDGGIDTFHDVGVSVASAAEVVATWSNGDPLVTAGPGPVSGRVVGLNFYPPSSDAAGDLWDATSDGALLMANALSFAAASATTNHPPTANAGPDQTLEAGAAGASFALAGAGADADGDPLTFKWENVTFGSGAYLTGTLPPPAAGVRSETHSFTLTVTDGHGGSASDDVVVTVADTKGPVLSNVPPSIVTANATSAAGAEVAYGPITALDAVDQARPVTCSRSGMFPVGDTPVTCTASDTRGNSTTAQFTVRVVNVTTPGTMWGEGTIRTATVRNTVEFAVSERGSVEAACLKLQVKDDRYPTRAGDRFTTHTTSFVAFSNDPAVQPGSPRVNTVQFSGSGEWNGRSGYRYEMSVVDKGDRAHPRMSVRLTVRSATGAVVARVEGTLGNGGNSLLSAPKR